MKTRTIAIGSQKGGVGKTTTVVNLAAWLALLKQKVLVIDLDPQGSTTRCLGQHGKTVHGGLKEVFETGALNLLRQDNIQDYIYPTALDNLSLLPSNIGDADTEIWLSQRAVEDPDVLKNVVDLALADYHFILIDAPPSLSSLPKMAFAAADSLLVPLQCEQMALSTMPRLIELIKSVQQSINPYLQIEGILLTMYDSEVTYAQTLLSQARKHFQGLVFKQMVPRDHRLSEATAAGRPVVLYDMHSPGSKAYRQLAEFLVQKHHPQAAVAAGAASQD
ncbi:MAG: ParA family protein [Candidatus Sericytochromatia bacterium]